MYSIEMIFPTLFSSFFYDRQKCLMLFHVQALNLQIKNNIKNMCETVFYRNRIYDTEKFIGWNHFLIIFLRKGIICKSVHLFSLTFTSN